MVSPIVAMFRRPVERARNRRRLEIVGVTAIREERYIRLGGIDQWVTIRGHDRRNPIVLVIHGGPGSPYTPFNSWLGDWEREFTVVQWDQRGGGKTFFRTGTAPALSLERLVQDGIELAELIVSRFGQKVILLGSSVGSLIGSMMVKRRPDLFTAYIAANILAPDPHDERYRAVREWAQSRSNHRALRDLDRIGAAHKHWSPGDALTFSKIGVTASEGAPDMVYDLMLPALMYDPTLSMSDIRRLDKGMSASLHALQPEYEDYDFDTLGFDYVVPVTLIQGERDLISPVTLARSYFDRITAPSKRFLPVADAGHLVEFVDPVAVLGEFRTAAGLLRGGVSRATSR